MLFANAFSSRQLKDEQAHVKDNKPLGYNRKIT